MKKEFQKRIQMLRGNVGQKTFSECCGLGKDTIRRYEKGEREPTLESAVKIADYCGVSLDWLAGRKNF